MVTAPEDGAPGAPYNEGKVMRHQEADMWPGALLHMRQHPILGWAPVPVPFVGEETAEQSASQTG